MPSHSFLKKPVNGLQAIAYSPEKDTLVAVGKSGIILYSTDHIHWKKKVKSRTNKKHNDVTWTGRKFIAVGDESTVLTSSDGVEWRQSNIRQSIDFNNIISSESYILASGYSFQHNAYTLLLSDDGVSFRILDFDISHAVLDMAWSGRLYISTGADGLFLTSHDGETWQSHGR